MKKKDDIKKEVRKALEVLVSKSRAKDKDLIDELIEKKMSLKNLGESVQGEKSLFEVYSQYMSEKDPSPESLENFILSYFLNKLREVSSESPNEVKKEINEFFKMEELLDFDLGEKSVLEGRFRKMDVDSLTLLCSRLIKEIYSRAIYFQNNLESSGVGALSFRNEYDVTMLPFKALHHIASESTLLFGLSSMFYPRLRKWGLSEAQNGSIPVLVSLDRDQTAAFVKNAEQLLRKSSGIVNQDRRKKVDPNKNINRFLLPLLQSWESERRNFRLFLKRIRKETNVSVESAKHYVRIKELGGKKFPLDHLFLKIVNLPELSLETVKEWRNLIVEYAEYESSNSDITLHPIIGELGDSRERRNVSSKNIRTALSDQRTRIIEIIERQIKIIRFPNPPKKRKSKKSLNQKKRL